jgi:hypothetical protein
MNISDKKIVDCSNCSFDQIILNLSDRRSRLQIIDETLSFTLKPNNTVVIAAKLNAEVSAKTW